jgi:mevalonate kinase
VEEMEIEEEEEGEEMVQARAPGKVIWSGEYAVVHGSAAVAAALWTVHYRSHSLSSSFSRCILSFSFLP